MAPSWYFGLTLGLPTMVVKIIETWETYNGVFYFYSFDYYLSSGPRIPID